MGTPLDTALAALDDTIPGLAETIRASGDVAQARAAVRAWLARRREALLDDGGDDTMAVSLALQSVEVLERLFAVRSERLSGESTAEWFRKAVRRESLGELSPGFVLEMLHAFRGALGKSPVSQGWLGQRLRREGVELVDFNTVSGREAGRARSDFLDAVGAHVWEQVARHPCGLDPALVQEREENRDRILAALGGTPEDWNDHRWQLRHLFTGQGSLERLKQIVPLSETDVRCIEACIRHGVPFGITPHYLSLFDHASADRERDGQVRSQVIPPPFYVQRMIEHREDRRRYFDFMGEYDTSPADLITRRYATVAILKGLDTCSQVCVYCQRNWEIEGPMQPGGFPSTVQLDQAIDWFADHPTINDVLVTGGDPFFHNPERIRYIMERLSAIEHVTHVRWGTRAPVTMPMQITDALADALGDFVEDGRRAVSVVTHVESAAEVTPDMATALRRLRSRAIPVYNQQVFVVEASRRFQTVALRVALKRVGIDPYYTFYAKGKEETRDYITPLARVLQERKEEARLLPGIFRTEEPVFNVPRLGKNHVRASQDRELVAIRPDGRRVYLWHPWEKGITPVAPWMYADVSIHEYLQRMADLGEDVGDYESIWYYY